MIKDNLPLYLIYNYSLDNSPVYGPLQSIPESHYFIIDFFSEIGEVSSELLQQHYQRFYGQLPEKSLKLGPFKSVEELTQFAQNICKDLLSPAVYILSTYDFNHSVEAILDAKSLKETMQAHAKKLTNIHAKSAKSHFFSRIFGDP